MIIPMIKSILLVGAGSFIGGVGRFLFFHFISRWLEPTFPLGTLAVNLLGSFLIGLLFGFFAKGALHGEGWQLFLIIGILGGFTTFSAFSLELMIMLRDGQFLPAILYGMGSLIFGLLVCAAGFFIARAF
jgi:fluoride exporter